MLVTPKQMYAAEQNCNKNYLSLEKLMDNAAGALADFVVAKGIQGFVLFLCGNGNNGGDGFVAARLLKESGYNVIVALICGEPKTELSKNAFEKLKSADVKIVSDICAVKIFIEKCGVLVDCVFGTGFKGELDDSLKELFSFETKALKIACDIPSGVNGLNGQCSDNAFNADFTVTFGRKKTGLAMYPAKDFCGKIHVCDIKIPNDSFCFDESIFEITSDSIKNFIPKRKNDSHKGNFGTLLCICGSESMIGACGMCVKAALRSGAGIVKAATPKTVRDALAGNILEAMWIALETDDEGFILENNYEKLIKSAKSASAVVIGCGLGVTEDTKKLVKRLICNINCPIILDADGINCIADSIDILMGKDNVIVTPHLGEASRLLKCDVSEIKENRIDTAKRLSFMGCTVVLKDAATIVARNNKYAINTSGNPGMSRGGSGDVLSGIIGALAAQGLDLFDAAQLGVYVHGLAGDFAAKRLSRQACLPSDFIDELCYVFSEFEKSAM